MYSQRHAWSEDGFFIELSSNHKLSRYLTWYCTALVNAFVNTLFHMLLAYINTITIFIKILAKFQLLFGKVLIELIQKVRFVYCWINFMEKTFFFVVLQKYFVTLHWQDVQSEYSSCQESPSWWIRPPWTQEEFFPESPQESWPGQEGQQAPGFLTGWLQDWGGQSWGQQSTSPC